MTVNEVGVRRSQRSTTSGDRSSQYLSDFSDIDESKSDQDSTSESDDDEEYFDTSLKKRKATVKAKNISKRQKQSLKNKLPSTVDGVSDFVENYIFQALSESDISINELATSWLEQYEENVSLAMKDLINSVLRSCGCILQIQEHDVTNNESAVETVGEIQQLFMKQQFHEYPLLTTNPKWKSFRSNVLEFFSSILSIANEKELLCNPEKMLMENLLIWLSAISTCSLRPLRYTSTVILLGMESSLCEIVTRTTANADRQQRQLEVETTKLKTLTEKLKKTKPLREKSKIEKDIANVERRLVQVKATVKSYKDQKSILDEYIKDITNTTFVHRYRDIDPKIRQECMSSLCEWMELYPEQFFETSYLRYFGWILSDKDSTVRLEVIKSLLRLYKKAVIVPGFRQFTERFKGRMIEMAIYDSDYNVRLHTISVLLEVSKKGFVDDEEMLKVSSLIFCDPSNKINLICNTKNKYLRLQHELVKLISISEGELSKEFGEKFKEGILNSKDSFSLDLTQLIKLKNLFSTLHDAYDYFVENYSNLEKLVPLNPNDKFISVYKMIYTLPNYSSSNLMEFLIKYLNLDVSAAELVDSSIKERVELSSFDKDMILCYICAISSIELGTEKSFYMNLIKSHNSFKSKDLESTTVMSMQDQTSNILLTYLPEIFTLVKNTKSSLEIFIKIFNIFLEKSMNDQGSRKSQVVDGLVKNILSVFSEIDIGFKDNQNSSEFSKFFKTISSKSGNLELSIEILIESTVSEISSNLMFNLKTLTDIDPVSNVMPMLNKLLIVSNCVDIIGNLEKNDSQSGESIIDLICDKFLHNEDFKKDEFESIALFYKLFSRYISQKLETTIADEKQQLISDNFVLSESLKHIAPIYITIRELAIEDGIPSDLKIESCVFFMDFLVALKAFQLKLTEKITILENDEKLADLNSFFQITVPLKVDQEFRSSIWREFLVMENKLAKFSGTELDRDEDEGVNFDSETDEDDENKDLLRRIIECENNLCRFTLKLLTLAKMNMLPNNMVKRLGLNKDQLNSELFAKLFERRNDQVLDHEVVEFKGSQG